MEYLKKYFLICLVFLKAIPGICQNETSKWYFGTNAGLDFSTSPPTILTGTLNTIEGCASISSSTGNLLFYTNGITVYTATHTVMANGGGLFGHASATQAALIVKQPGNINLYYVFSLGANGSGNLYYSIVDMSLAAGAGSVTSKNVLLHANCNEKLTSIRHCNGTDVWIIYHEAVNSTNYRANLLTSTGINTIATVSNIGSTNSGGYLKSSPNGRKLAAANFTATEIFDFDASSGIISNPLVFLNNSGSANNAYGCEFSPDGTKFYISNYTEIYQYNLCAGSNTAIIASQYTVSSNSSWGSWAMQLALDGKIYVARELQQSLGVVNNPNVAGAGCNYTVNGQSIGANQSRMGLPNFPSHYFLQKPIPPPFTYTSSCLTTSFNAPITPTAVGCVSSGYSLTATLWNFGDPSSGVANTSTLLNPSHIFSATGTYTTELIFQYSCGGGADTLRQLVTVNGPTLNITTASITCASLGSASVTTNGGIGPYSYTWMPTNQASSVATGLAPGTYSIFVYDSGLACQTTNTVTFSSLIPLTGSLSATNSFVCAGASSGTAVVSNLAGGSGTENYFWINNTSTLTTPYPTSLTAGTWSVTVTDALTGCQVFSVFTITEPPASTLNLSANSTSVCLGSSIVLTGTNSGGTPGYTYSWTNGPAGNSHTVSESSGATYQYTLNSFDANNCLTSNTIAVDFVNNPKLSVSDFSICPHETGTLTASGASTYTWSDNSNGNTLSDNPLISTQYTVTGSALGCTSVATASIILKPLPIPFINSNSPRCENASLQLTAFGGSGYSWSGPLNYVSASQNPVINPVGLTHAGVYDLTVTAANGCTAATSTTVMVNPTPTLSAAGSTVCTIQTASLTASSLPGSSYQWTGPLSFSSSQQNPTISSPSISASGSYTVKATSAVGCTNTAIANIQVVPPPSLTAQLSSHSLCSQAFNGSPNTITLTAGGANTYSLVTVPDMFNSNPSGPVSPLSSIPPYTGIASATLSGSNGVCTVTTSLTFSIIPNPTVSVNNYTPEICAGQSFTYTNAGANSYTWSNSTPNFTTYHNGGVAVAHPSINSVFSVYGGSLGCNSASQTSTITVHPIPTVSITPGSASVCPGSSVVLSVEGTATSFIWHPFVGLSQQNGAQVVASPLTNQIYTVTGSANNCTNTAVAGITVLPLPTPLAKASKSAVCANETIQLIGEGGEIYRWYGPNNFEYGGQTIQFKAYPFNQGDYTLTVTDKNGCKNSTSLPIVVNPLPGGSLIGNRMQGCIPFCSDFRYDNAAASGSLITTNWQIGQKNYAGKTFSHCFTKIGEQVVTGNFKDTRTGCLNTQTFVVVGLPVPTANFRWLPEKPIEGIEDVLFFNSSEGEKQESFYWSFIDNKNYKSQSENTSYFFSEAGTYPVAFIVKNSFGCSDTIVKLVDVEPDFLFYIPNAFTPNGDDRNDLFIPVVRGVKKYELQVFNRWGNLIFLTSDLRQGWDGTFNSEGCKQDVYVWKVILSTSHGELKEYSGQVTLLR